MFLFLYLTLLIAKKTNTSVVVIGCREKHNIYKSFDIHFNFDNKEYSLTLKNREKKTKKQKSGLRYAPASNRSFCTTIRLLSVCLSAGAKRQHLYQDKHTSKCQYLLQLLYIKKFKLAVFNFILSPINNKISITADCFIKSRHS